VLGEGVVGEEVLLEPGFAAVMAVGGEQAAVEVGVAVDVLGVREDDDLIGIERIDGDGLFVLVGPGHASVDRRADLQRHGRLLALFQVFDLGAAALSACFDVASAFENPPEHALLLIP
jgi:hypothetical protein